ncbi:MAG: hypothetical protein SNJ52_00795 [Verrucomicrobiia bacterium]
MKSQAHWIFAAAASALLFVMVDHQSFWIDETCSAIYAKQPTLENLVAFAKSDSLAEPLQPLSVITNWLWSRLSGTGEYALRAQNIVWGLVSLIAMALIGHRLQMPWLPLVLAIQPFFWIYTNELRPYAGQIAIGSWLALAVSAAFEKGALVPPTWRTLLWGLLALMISSVLAPLTLGPLLALLALWSLSHRWPFRPLPWLTLGVVALSGLALGWYYLLVLRSGATGVRMWEISPLNLAYMGYEFVGALGFGPALAELREAYRQGLLWDFLQNHRLAFGLAALHGTLVGGFLLAGWFGLKEASRRSLLLFGLAVCAAVAITLWMVGYLTQKAFWARHLAPVFPFFVVATGLAVRGCLGVPTPFGVATRLLAILTLSSFFASSLVIGFGSAHVKSDVRRAAELAREALDASQRVWWSGEMRAAIFYDVRVDSDQSSPDLLVINRGDAEDVKDSLPPHLVVYSHREFFARWPAFLEALNQTHGRYDVEELPGFKILRRAQENQPR